MNVGFLIPLPSGLLAWSSVNTPPHILKLRGGLYLSSQSHASEF
jgi:hypothetical protein